MDSGKIGRFGLSFCSSYNFTDVPQLVSGSKYMVLDPHTRFLGSDGKRMDLSDPSNLKEAKDFPGFFEPHITLKVEGVPSLDLDNSPYAEGQGTIFRLPFRTAQTLQEASEGACPCWKNSS